MCVWGGDSRRLHVKYCFTVRELWSSRISACSNVYSNVEEVVLAGGSREGSFLQNANNQDPLFIKEEGVKGLITI